MQKREKGEYQPSPDTFQHVEATLQLLSVMTNDRRFEEAYDVNQPEGGVSNMCDVLEKVEKRGINKGIDIGREEGREKGREEGREKGREEGREKGREEGREEERLNNIQLMMQALKLTAQQAMDVLKIPTEDRLKYTAKLKSI